LLFIVISVVHRLLYCVQQNDLNIQKANKRYRLRQAALGLKPNLPINAVAHWCKLCKKREYLFAKTQIQCYHTILHTVGGLPKDKSLINAGHP